MTKSKTHSKEKSRTHATHRASKTTFQTTYRGKPDKRPIKFIFVNTDGNICFAPSLTWICSNYRLSKGSISDVKNNKVRSYMGWYSIDMSMLDQVVKLLEFNESWVPTIGMYNADPDKSYEFIMKHVIF